ncbi:hypothetical protein [Phormidium sp. CCY1219]|uniref:hypothetical protein n=1 Tax=Phormidium sp. CCY1219 TaxID=2886104 RepID=UPI002D1EF9BB|nr:hypothetical protein [Phormidium sp. CCY1219]MEB3827541.1 hypothetical protein [Phormidium sp. CCY1219]
MSRLLYEKSVAYLGHLIIPYLFGTVDRESIYSYKLLSELGHKGIFHKAENPAGMYSSSVDGIIEIAREHLEEYSDVLDSMEVFQQRYTYRDNLIIVYEMGGKYFYDHFKPDSLKNLAAPKIFKSKRECINWIKKGLDRSRRDRQVKKA